jgi:8-oxo-dGTP pyrophosphatase MutT (NUDIX family)
MRAGRVRSAVAGPLTVLVLALAGCAAPPAGSEAALDALADRLRAVPGIASVETSLREVDPKDSSDWTAGVDVESSGSDLSIAADVREAIGRGVPGALLQVGLSVEAGGGSSAVSLDPRRESDVELAEQLRVLPFAERVDLLVSRSVELERGVAFAEAVAAVRSVADTDPERGDVAVHRGTTGITVDEAHPGADLVAALDVLDADPRVESISSWSAWPDGVRASVDVTTDDIDRIAEMLAATADEAADAATRPRTRFTVFTPDYSEDRSGWLGLPLGSSEPDDLALGGPPGPVIDPAEAAARLAAGEAGVRAFLESAVLTAGIPAEVATDLEECPDGSGTRMAGRVIIPVFTVLDSAQEPFDAIVAGWSAEGLEQTDRAMGRDYWAPRATREDAVDSASIRGTTEGLSLTAAAECVPG